MNSFREEYWNGECISEVLKDSQNNREKAENFFLNLHYRKSAYRQLLLNFSVYCGPKNSHNEDAGIESSSRHELILQKIEGLVFLPATLEDLQPRQAELILILNFVSVFSFVVVDISHQSKVNASIGCNLPST